MWTKETFLKYIPLQDEDDYVPVTLNVTNISFINAISSGDGIKLEISTKVSYKNYHIVNSSSFKNVSRFFKTKKWMKGQVFKWQEGQLGNFWYPPIQFQHILESNVDMDSTNIE